MVTETDKQTTTVKPKYDFLKKANESGELGIFDTDAMKDLIEFKYSEFSFNFHLTYFCFHCFYTITLFVYITEIYTLNHLDNRKNLLILMAVGTIVPMFYDTYQLYDQGIISYLSSFYNWFDFIFIWSGVAFIILSFVYEDPFETTLKFLMMTIITCSITRSLFFMRIIPALTPLVTLMK